MNELEVKRVPFMGADLMAAKDEIGTIWAGVRWMCDGMGMSEGQRKRQIASIQTDHLLSKGGSNLILPTAGGKQSVPIINESGLYSLVLSRAQLARQIAELTKYSA